MTGSSPLWTDPRASRRRQRRWLCRDVEPDLTARAAFPVYAALKDRSHPLLIAIWAYEVRACRAVFAVLKRIDDAAGLGPVKFIAVKVALHGVRRSQMFMKVKQAELHLRVRDLRVGYLRHKFGQKGFDIRVSRRLRRLEKALDAPEKIDGMSCRPDPGTGEVYEILNRLEVEIHQFFLVSQRLSGASSGSKAYMRDAA